MSLGREWGKFPPKFPLVWLPFGSVQVLHKRRRGGGGQTSIAYVAYAFMWGRGVPEQIAYVMLELFVLPIRTSLLQTHICINPFLWSYALTPNPHYDEVVLE